jgi:hypothetical protein
MTPSRRTRRTNSSNGSRVIPLHAPDHIRWTKVMTAQARIAVGYYDREDVKRLLLEAVMRELKRH